VVNVQIYDILLKMFHEIKNEKNIFDWKIVIIQPVIKERGGENPKTAQKFYFC